MAERANFGELGWLWLCHAHPPALTALRHVFIALQMECWRIPDDIKHGCRPASFTLPYYTCLSVVLLNYSLEINPFHACSQESEVVLF